MNRLEPRLAAVVWAAALASTAHAAPIALPISGASATTVVAYNGDPYSGRPRGGGGRKHASKKTPEPPADISKGESADQHKAYLKKYGF